MANMYLFWDGASPPAGWEIVSDSGGDFYQRYIRGAANYSLSGAVHSHAINIASITVLGRLVYDGATPRSVAKTHAHEAGTLLSDTIEYPYHTLRVIKYTGIPTDLPAGVIAIFSSMPSRWTRQTALDGRFVKSSTTAGSQGGSDSHSHSLPADVGYVDDIVYTDIDIRFPYGYDDHTHAISGSVSTTSYLPPYIDVIIAKKDTSGKVTTGMIAMFDADPGPDWTIRSDAGGPFNSRLIRGAATYGTTGGGGSHNHSITPDTTSATTPATHDVKLDEPKLYYIADAQYDALQDHTHGISSGSITDALPSHINVIFAELNAKVPVLSITSRAATGVVLDVTANEVETRTLQVADNPNGPWTDVETVNGDVFQFTVSQATRTFKFYRCNDTDVYGTVSTSNVLAASTLAEVKVQDTFGGPGIFDVNDQPIENARVFIMDANTGVILHTGTTDASGKVSFEEADWPKLAIFTFDPLRDNAPYALFQDEFSDLATEWVKLAGAGSASVVSDAQASGGNALEAVGYVWYEHSTNISLDERALYRIRGRVRQVSDPTTGGKGIYIGVTGVASDGTTRININGADSYTSQHYFAADGDTLAVDGYTEFVGYFWYGGTSAGGKSPNRSAPGLLYPNIAYIRPMFILNYADGDGTARIDYLIIEKVAAPGNVNTGTDENPVEAWHHIVL